jgi:hypothetical protein
MNESALRAVAEQVLHRAQAHGFVVPRDIRADLSQAGFADTRWKEVLALVQARLRYRHGRYYYVSSVATHMRGRAEREHRQHDLVHQVVRRVIEQVRPGPFFLHGGAFLDVAAKTDWLKIVQ